MRVIAGKARRLTLIAPGGEDTRPTTDRIKETLFNILAPDIYEVRFLDLFAGSGGIGIEALSRGASGCVFVENGREALRCIKENLRVTRLFSQAQLMETDVFSALKKLDIKKDHFDIVFMDPPYREGYHQRVLELLSTSSIISEATMIIAEALIDEDFSFAASLGFEVYREKNYKTNKHVFLRKICKES